MFSPPESRMLPSDNVRWAAKEKSFCLKQGTALQFPRLKNWQGMSMGTLASLPQVDLLILRPRKDDENIEERE